MARRFRRVGVTVGLFLLAAAGCGPAARRAGEPSVSPTDAGAREADRDRPVPAPTDAPDGGAAAHESPVPHLAPRYVTFSPPTAALGAAEGQMVGRVFSGAVWERGSVRLGGAERLVVPPRALVATGAARDTVEVYVEKRLAFRGHPPERMPEAGLRRNLGVAWRRQDTGEDTRVVLATYGEWDSRIEGRASMSLVVRVPEDLWVVVRPGLDGPESEAMAWDPSTPPSVTDRGRVGYWYAPVNPSPGWTALALRPDDRRVAGAEHPPRVVVP